MIDRFGWPRCTALHSEPQGEAPRIGERCDAGPTQPKGVRAANVGNGTRARHPRPHLTAGMMMRGTGSSNPASSSGESTAKPTFVAKASSQAGRLPPVRAWSSMGVRLPKYLPARSSAAPPAIKRRAIDAGGRQMGGAAVTFPMSFYAKGLEGHIDNLDAGWKGRRLASRRCLSTKRALRIRMNISARS